MTETKRSGAGASIDIVFDGPPSDVSGRFVEVESPPGTSIKFGEWVLRKDGYWVLRIDDPESLRARRALLEARVARLEGVARDLVDMRNMAPGCKNYNVVVDDARRALEEEDEG